MTNNHVNGSGTAANLDKVFMHNIRVAERSWNESKHTQYSINTTKHYRKLFYIIMGLSNIKIPQKPQ